MSIYRSSDGESKILAFYESQLANLPIQYETQTLDTLFGLARVLVAGPDDAEPLVVLHDLYFTAPFSTEIWFALSDEFRVYSVDIIDQPGRKAEDRPPPTNNNYGRWVVDILNCLGLRGSAFVGVGLGAAILLDAAVYAPDRISQAVLVTPAAIAPRSATQTLSVYFRLFVPSLVYRYLPNRKRLVQAVRPLVSEIDEDLLQYLDLVIRHLKLRVGSPGPFDEEELERFTAPTLLVVAKSDALFPLNQVVPRARDIIQKLIAVEVLEGSHIPTRQAQHHVSSSIRRFLKENRTAGTKDLKHVGFGR